MTFDDDFVEFQMLGGRHIRATLKNLNLIWPPPIKIEFFGFPFRRTCMSAMSDDERKSLTGVCRGAIYESVHQTPDLRPGITGAGGQVTVLDDKTNAAS